MLRTFFFSLLSLMGILVSGCAEPPNYGVLDFPTPEYNRCADPSERAVAKEDYELEMLQDYMDMPLSERGLEWTMENMAQYEAAGIFARCRNTEAEIPVLINYYGGIGSRDHFFKYGDTEEEEIVLEETFRQLMEELMEEVFPGYNFFLTFNREGELKSADDAVFIIHVAYDKDRFSYAAGKEVFLIYPTIIGHEAGHLCPAPEDDDGFCMGFPHHYWNNDTSDHSHGPPEEDEGTCIMYRNGNTFGRTESIAALLTYSPDAQDKIYNLGTQIRAMLPDEMSAREDIYKCGTVMNSPLTDRN